MIETDKLEDITLFGGISLERELKILKLKSEQSVPPYFVTGYIVGDNNFFQTIVGRIRRTMNILDEDIDDFDINHFVERGGSPYNFLRSILDKPSDRTN